MQDISVHDRRWYSHCPVLLVLLAFTLSSICFAREKKDVVQFVNGDRMTCEIVRLEKGYLYVKLAVGEGTVSLDWSKISHIESPQTFVVADKTGVRYTGSLQSTAEGKAPEKMELQVTEPSTSEVIPAKDVVELHTTDPGFWPNLHGGMDAGVNYSKQQNRTQYNFQTNALFERAKWLASGNYESSFSGGGNISDLRNEVRLNITETVAIAAKLLWGTRRFLTE